MAGCEDVDVVKSGGKVPPAVVDNMIEVGRCRAHLKNCTGNGNTPVKVRLTWTRGNPS